MALKVPKNQIIISKYTSGGEYVTDKEYKNYQGYYYELNNKAYVGKEFNATSSILLKANSPDVNKLITNPFTSIYGAVSGIKINNLSPSSYYFNPDIVDTSNVFRYFTKKINSDIIKEISKDSFDQIKFDPLYISVSLFYQNSFNENELNDADKKIPGLKDYINSTYTPGVTD